MSAPRSALAAAGALALAMGWGTAAWGQGPESPLPPGADVSRLAPSMTARESALAARAGDDAQPGPVDAARYRLGPGDVLELDLWGRLARTVLLDVSPDGKIYVPGSGTREVSGRTLATVREQLLADVGRAYRGVEADIRLARARKVKVYVSGLVDSPGSYSVSATTRASEVLALAGLAANASRRNIELLRPGAPASEHVDVLAFDVSGELTHDPFLEGGEVLHVPGRRSVVVMAGAFVRPGEIEYADGDSLGLLVRLAGGFAERARRDRALLLRPVTSARRESTWVDMSDSSGFGSRRVQPDDRVFATYLPDDHFVPAAQVVGEVRMPGSYPIVLGRDRLSDLVRWAGGTNERADRASVLFVRAGRSQGSDPQFERLAHLSRAEMTDAEYAAFQTRLAEQRNSFRVDLDHVSRSGPDVDPILESGDLVRVDPLVLSVRVEGEVRRPGFVEFRPGRSVNEYVTLAGGYTSRAAAGAVRVSRSLTGQVVPARKLRDVSAGDFIWVPERHDVNFWELFKDVLTVAGQVAVIVVAARR